MTTGWLVTGRGSIRFEGTTIEYEFRHSKRRKKTVQITIDGRGVKVAAPSSTPESELQAIVRKRAPWILRYRSQALLETPPKRFVSGETMPYLGRNVPLVVEDTDLPWAAVRFDHWRFRVAAPHSLTEGERREGVRRALVEWYQARAVARLEASVERWRRRLGHEARPRVLVRDQRRRWGSCAPDGTLRFNWRAVMLEPALMEYIAVHELAHLKVKNHSPDFWELVAKALPDLQRRRRRLREAGRALPL